MPKARTFTIAQNDARQGDKHLRPVTLITGGSQGIGLELAHCFAAHGQDIILIARDETRLQQAVKIIADGQEARSQKAIKILPLALDLTEEGALAKIDKMLAAHAAYADILVNNAGIGLSGDFAAHSPDDLEALIKLNVTVATELMRHVLPGMIERGRGGILNVASLGGLTPGPFQATYYASKAYLISLSEAVKAEVRHSGVRICALAPGPVHTNFHDRIGSQDDFYYRFLPVLSARRVAKAGYRGYMWRSTVIIPGIMNKMLAISLRLLPHPIVIPVISFLLRPRQLGSEDA